MLPVRWLDRDWVCLPERALWWPQQRALICADLHAGKDEAFRRAGLPMPEGALADDLLRLDAAIQKTTPRMLVILGDFFHARDGRGPRVTECLKNWRARHSNLEIVIVRGNHDYSAGDPPRFLSLRVEHELIVDGLSLKHAPPNLTQARPKNYIAGHLHPAIRISTAGESIISPCFWFRKEGIVLPAFSSLAGSARIQPKPKDRVVLIGSGDSMISWPP